LGARRRLPCPLQRLNGLGFGRRASGAAGGRAGGGRFRGEAGKTATLKRKGFWGELVGRARVRGIQGRRPYKENVSEGFSAEARRAARGAASGKEPPGEASAQGAGTLRYKHANAPRKSSGVTRSRVQGAEAGGAAGAALCAVVCRRGALRVLPPHRGFRGDSSRRVEPSPFFAAPPSILVAS
jgi:hypothetical protein